jgi:hypothetical protein
MKLDAVVLGSTNFTLLSLLFSTATTFVIMTLRRLVAVGGVGFQKSCNLYKVGQSPTSYTSTYLYIYLCRSQWPCGLRRGSAATRLLGSWVRIPPGAWMSVSCECCCQVEVSATSWSLVQTVVCLKCVTMKPRRNEEAQAHIGLSSHRKKYISVYINQEILYSWLYVFFMSFLRLFHGNLQF